MLTICCNSCLSHKKLGAYSLNIKNTRGKHICNTCFEKISKNMRQPKAIAHRHAAATAKLNANVDQYIKDACPTE